MEDKNWTPECMCLSLRMTTRALSQIYDDALRPVGLRVTQFSLLRSIARLQPVTFQRLSETLVLDQTTLPRSLRVLEKEGLIRIERGEDRRERLASLTAKGKTTLAAALPVWRRAQEEVRTKFSGARLDKLSTELAAMRRVVAG